MIAEQVEIVAVAFVIEGPGFAGSLFVVAEHENDDVGFRATLTASAMRLAFSAGSPSTTLSASQSGSVSVIFVPSE